MQRIFSATLAFWLCVFCAGITPQGFAAPVPLKLSDRTAHELTLTPHADGTYEVKIIGGDPYLFTEALPTDANVLTNHVLAFEYFSTSGTDHLQVFLAPNTSEALSYTTEGLSVAEGWSAFSVDLKALFQKANGQVRGLRLDFGTRPSGSFQIRALKLRPPSEQELALIAREVEQQQFRQQKDDQLGDYLRHAFQHIITQVTVGETNVTIAGKIKDKTPLFLAEVPLSAEVVGLKQFPLVQPIQANTVGDFSVSVPRIAKSESTQRDRLLSRWAIVQKAGDSYALQSHLHYADTIFSSNTLPEEKPRNKKGLGALWPGRPFSDLADLDISGVTVNISLNSFMRTTAGDGRTPFTYAGKTWYAEDGYVAALDKTMLTAAQRKIIVSAIILINHAHESPDKVFGKLIAHPDAHPAGIYVMPNLNSMEGVEAYAAGMDFLARRYSQPDKAYGRIHHWIMHNEVDAGWQWTNAGDKPARTYLELYHRSMRLAHLIARQYDPHAKAFISLTHHWAETVAARFYTSKELLELLLDFSRKEGDFDWAIAYHPYAQDLGNPRTWEDNQPTFRFDTPKITYRNIEVLDAWVRQPQTFFQGQRQRTVHLTEQGLNSPKYTEKSLREQAAGMAYAWNKIKHLTSIELFHYHNWQDNRHEGGLKIGLRRYPDDETEPDGKKPIWFIYQAMGTDKEDEATAYTKEIIGIKEWSEILHREPIR